MVERPVQPPPTPPASSPRRVRGWRRAFLIATGCLSMVLGGLGVVLPLLPTTPFILLAALCFASSWPAMHERLARSRAFGPMVRSEEGGRYIPRRTKAYAIAFTLVSIGATIVLALDTLLPRLLLGSIALGVTGFLLWMPSAPRTDC